MEPAHPGSHTEAGEQQLQDMSQMQKHKQCDLYARSSPVGAPWIKKNQAPTPWFVLGFETQGGFLRRKDDTYRDHDCGEGVRCVTLLVSDR